MAVLVRNGQKQVKIRKLTR